jgi:predicted Fe-S protein YdhL (DUF1289 family)
MSDTPASSLTTVQARRDLSSLLNELQTRLHDSSDLGRAQSERDHWMLMWDETMQNVLKNMEDSRNDHRKTREQLADASTAGSADTDRVIAAIESATVRILNQITGITVKPQTDDRNEPWWRFW